MDHPTPPPTGQTKPPHNNYPPTDSKGTACIGCRLRRKRCDKKQPICTGCNDLQIPRELCIYRKMGLSSKDSRATLAKEVKKNRELKDDQVRAGALLKYNNKTTGSTQQDYFFLKDTRHGNSFKHLQLNPEKNPLLCTVMSGPQITAYLGSISLEAITESEPQMKLLLQQIHKVIMKEEIIQDGKLKEQSAQKSNRKELVVDAFNEHCKAASVGMKTPDGDSSIRELIKDIESNFPSKKACEFTFKIFFNQNNERYTIFPYVHEETFRRKFNQYVTFHNNDGNSNSNNNTETVRFNVDPTKQPEELIFIAWVLSILAIAAFCYGQYGASDFQHMDYVLLAKYSLAITRIDVIGKEIRLGEHTMGTPEFISLHFTLLLLGKYTASAGFMNSMEELCEATLSIRSLITLAMTSNLHNDLDRYYPCANLGEKKQMKTLWYTLVLYETFESMDIGFISKYEPASFRRYDYCYNHLIEAIHVVHGVLFTYNMIDDMGKVDDLLEFLENNLIKRLKKVLKDEFKTMDEDITTFQTIELSDVSKESLDEYAMVSQRIGMRYLILTTILAFYHIALKRLEQIGEGDSEQSRRYRLLGWKYTLTIETLFREMWIGFNRIGNHSNYFEFYPVAAMLSMAPILRFAQRRVTLFATSRFLSMLNVDDQLIVNYVLYGDDHFDAPILKSLEESGELDTLYKISDFDDMDIDDDYDKLMEKFGQLDNLRFLVISLSKLISDTLALMRTGQTTFNFMKLTKIFHVLLLRLCSFLLYYTVQEDSGNMPKKHTVVQGDQYSNSQHSNGNGNGNKKNNTAYPGGTSQSSNTDEPHFDFKNFFTGSQDITVDDEEIFQLFSMTSRTRFW